MRKVKDRSILLMKVRDLYFSNEKGMTIIVNRFNESLFLSIYVFSTFTRFPYFNVLEYEQSGKKYCLVKSIKFIKPTVLLHKKGIYANCIYKRIMMGCSPSPPFQGTTTPLILLSLQEPPRVSDGNTHHQYAEPWLSPSSHASASKNVSATLTPSH